MKSDKNDRMFIHSTRLLISLRDMFLLVALQVSLSTISGASGRRSNIMKIEVVDLTGERQTRPIATYT